jgi:hypothetical protein
LAQDVLAALVARAYSGLEVVAEACFKRHRRSWS